MFRRDTPVESHLRREAQRGLDATPPLGLRGRTARPPPAELMPWYQALSRKGWIAPHWPKRYGGMGATLNEQIIITEELARIGAPQLPAQGLNHIGPILMEFGTEAQKAQHLPPIIAGTVIWAQGYSEPGAGSDLASLSTRATLEVVEALSHRMDLHLTSEQTVKFIAAAGPKVARAFRERDPSFAPERLHRAGEIGWLGM